MLMTALVVLASSVALQEAPVTPADCLTKAQAFAAERQKSAPRPLTSAVYKQIQTDQAAMARECAARFDVKSLPPDQLPKLVELYAVSAQMDLARAAIDHGLATLPAAQKAALIPVAVTTTLRTEPKGEARNARLEKLVDELDANADATFAQKMAAHSSMNGYYRGDDIDAGILKHSNWIMAAAKTMTPEERKQFGHRVLSAYSNAAEVHAGQGRNDEALALLKRAVTELSYVPNVASDLERTIARYSLVGKPAAPITAPVWLNMPTDATELPMAGHVTLLEFTAHWCGPCRESYPGINRLRAKYGAQGFRVVLATQLYGYFGTEPELPADAEIARDRNYFAEHGMDVPIAIARRTPPPTPAADGTRQVVRDRNDENYIVGGIPQIHLIDRQGRIRLIMIGYDDANEQKLGEIIEKMLAEK
jgi:thiol-disulfide isomerase/thioredoxin